MNVKLNLGAWGSVFAVPSRVTDCLRIADGKQLKVLLALLRNAERPLSDGEIAALTGVSPCDVGDALLFWENVGILAPRGDSLIPAEGDPVFADLSAGVLPPPPSAVSISSGSEKPKVEPLSPAARAKLGGEPQFPPKEIAAAVNTDESVRYLFETFERLAGRPTRHAERNALMILTEEAGMPSEVAVMLVEYCFSIDRATPAYLKAAALEWVESGIDTIGKAEERIKLLRSRHTLESRLRAKFGRTSAFSKSEKELIALWAEANYPEELLDEAYDLCMKNTGRLSLKYMDTVLRSWAEKGYTTAEQARGEKKPAEKELVGSSFDVNDVGQAAYGRYKKLGGKEGTQ